jgi:hypothetical protein
MPLGKPTSEVEQLVMGLGDVASLQVDVTNQANTFTELAIFFRKMIGVRTHLETVEKNIKQDDDPSSETPSNDNNDNNNDGDDGNGDDDDNDGGKRENVRRYESFVSNEWSCLTPEH